jgi:hypothetical protein
MSDESPAERRRRLRRERKRRYLERLRYGRAVAAVEFTESMVDFLVASKQLTEDEASDNAAVGRAIANVLMLSMLRKKGYA